MVLTRYRWEITREVYQMVVRIELPKNALKRILSFLRYVPSVGEELEDVKEVEVKLFAVKFLDEYQYCNEIDLQAVAKEFDRYPPKHLLSEVTDDKEILSNFRTIGEVQNFWEECVRKKEVCVVSVSDIAFEGVDATSEDGAYKINIFPKSIWLWIRPERYVSMFLFLTPLLINHSDVTFLYEDDVSCS